MTILTRKDERLLHLIEEGSEEEFMRFKVTKLKMPFHTATLPWFRKNNAYQWIFARDAYLEFTAEELIHERQTLDDHALAPTATPDTNGNAPVPQPPQPDVPAASNPKTTTVNDGGQSSKHSIESSVSATPTVSKGKQPSAQQQNRKRKGNVKSLLAGAHPKRIRCDSEIIDLTSEGSSVPSSQQPIGSTSKATTTIQDGQEDTMQIDDDADDSSGVSSEVEE